MKRQPSTPGTSQGFISSYFLLIFRFSHFFIANTPSSKKRKHPEEMTSPVKTQPAPPGTSHCSISPYFLLILCFSQFFFSEQTFSNRRHPEEKTAPANICLRCLQTGMQCVQIGTSEGSTCLLCKKRNKKSANAQQTTPPNDPIIVVKRRLPRSPTSPLPAKKKRRSKRTPTCTKRDPHDSPSSIRPHRRPTINPLSHGAASTHEETPRESVPQPLHHLVP